MSAVDMSDAAVALLAVKQLREEGKERPRASTTDADARVMKMPDGGYRPGYR